MRPIAARPLLSVLVCVSLVGSIDWLRAQDPTTPQELDGRDGRNLALDRFRPQSMLRVKNRELNRAKFSAVDVHTHPGRRLRG